MRRAHSGSFAGKQLSARSDFVVFNEASGSTTAVADEKQALRLYLQLSQQPRVRLDKLHILRWSHDQWTKLDPESLKG